MRRRLNREEANDLLDRTHRRVDSFRLMLPDDSPNGRRLHRMAVGGSIESQGEWPVVFIALYRNERLELVLYALHLLWDDTQLQSRGVAFTTAPFDHGQHMDVRYRADGIVMIYPRGPAANQPRVVPVSPYYL